MVVRIRKTHTLGRKLDSAGIDAVVANLRGLTEEEAERAVSQALVTPLCALSGDHYRHSGCQEGHAEAHRHVGLCRHSGLMSGIGGLGNLKNWLAFGGTAAWEEKAREFGLEPPKGVIILGVQGCGKSLCARAIAVSGDCPWLS